MPVEQEPASAEHLQLIQYAKDVGTLYQELKAENALLKTANRELAVSYYHTVFMGFDLISLNDEFLGGHCRRVARYAGELAEALGMDKEKIIATKLSALLHDMGLIGIPKKTIVEMLMGRNLSEDKLEIYKQHPIVNVRPITSNEKFKDIAGIISAHHENMDGSGFPNGLKGDEISVESRIIAIVSAYDMSKQLSRKAIDPGNIISEMEKDAGTKYDISILRTFKKAIIKQDPFTNTIDIHFRKLSPNMILAKPLMAARDVKLLSAETEIREDHIASINKYFKHHKSVPQITIYTRN